MNTAAIEVLEYLTNIGIEYSKLEHDPVHTIEDCAPIGNQLNAIVAKNYFLSTRNKKDIRLCLVRPDAHFHSSAVSAQLGTSRLSFGSEDILEQFLKTRPGAVTPLGLLFDRENKVHLVIDDVLLSVPRIAFHPCDNTVTVAMRTEDFLNVFLISIGHKYVTISFRNM